MTLTIEDHAADWLVALHAPQDRDAPAVLRPSGPADEVLHANLSGMLLGWRDFPEAMDFLAPRSPNAAWKGLMTRLYAEQIDELLGSLPQGRVLDLACGIGRFARALLEAGSEVDGVDATRPSLEAAGVHLAPFAGRVRLLWGDVTDPAALAALAPPYDAAFALELLCYLPDPAAALQAWLPLLRPGAPLILSVEAWPGALLADPVGLDAGALGEALRTRCLHEPGVRHVRAFTRAELVALLHDSGFQDLRVAGTHYVLDGPLGALAEPSRLEGPDGDTAETALLALERLLRSDLNVDVPPRAWIAVAHAPPHARAPGAPPTPGLS